MSKLLTTKEVMEYLNVKDSRTVSKFRKEGLKFIQIGSKDFRYRQEDVEEFLENKIQLAQEKIIQINPIRRKVRSRTLNVDYQKKKINLEQMKVV